MWVRPTVIKVLQCTEIKRNDKTAKLSPHFLLPINSELGSTIVGLLQTNTQSSVSAAAQSFYHLG